MPNTMSVDTGEITTQEREEIQAEYPDYSVMHLLPLVIMAVAHNRERATEILDPALEHIDTVAGRYTISVQEVGKEAFHAELCRFLIKASILRDAATADEIRLKSGGIVTGSRDKVIVLDHNEVVFLGNKHGDAVAYASVGQELHFYRGLEQDEFFALHKKNLLGSLLLSHPKAFFDPSLSHTDRRIINISTTNENTRTSFRSVEVTEGVFRGMLRLAMRTREAGKLFETLKIADDDREQFLLDVIALLDRIPIQLIVATSREEKVRQADQLMQGQIKSAVEAVKDL